MAAATVLSGAVAWACNTPVYRYAMYNWPATPYRVFHFHEGPASKEDLAVNRQLAEAGRAQTPLNVTVETVDVAVKEHFAKLPAPVRKAWDTRPSGTTSLHAIFNTHGQQIYVGRLDPAAAKTFIASPARRRLAELLEQGHAGVLVLLASPKADQTREAEQVIDEVLRRVQAGEIAAPATDGVNDGPTDATPQDTAKKTEQGAADDDQVRTNPKQLTIARMTVSRTNPAESWLVRALLAVEDDLGQYAEEPMVFAVYGRARAMPPFVGKGITIENLAEGVAFLAGACSCVIKDENPGVDLLVGWNWDATAETLAADEAQPPPGDTLTYRESSPEAFERKAVQTPPKPSTAKPAAKPAVTASDMKAVATAGTAPPGEEDSARYVRRQARVVLLTLAVVAIVVLTVGMIWFRRVQASNS
jgi:hypothetical protein